MKSTTPTDQWPIYNCHIHTFTRKHTPKNFIKWVLADSERGKINLLKFFSFLILFVLYVAVVFILGSELLSARLNALNMPLYAFLLLLEGLMTVPLIVLTFLVVALIVVLLIQATIDAALDWRSRPGLEPQSDQPIDSLIHKGQEMVAHANILIDLLVMLNPTSSNDIFERIARFLKIAAQPSQGAVFEQIRKQYQTKEIKTRFVVLPMDMTHMELGELKESIDLQHVQLLDLAKEYEGQIIPFYAADPRQKDVVEKVRTHVVNGPFRGIKIYPNLGYSPDDSTLMKIYGMCAEHGIPVMTHCSPGGIWKYGLPAEARRAYSQPATYKRIFKEYPTLKLCLAHFGGAQEWARRLNREVEKEKYLEEPWVRTIYDMIAEGQEEYPNLYTDISYTVFTPKIKGLYIDLIDYLKVLLSHPRVRTRVLFGSDYYMIEQEKMSEKEASILLRSRLGEDLYKQIAYFNPMEFLGETPRAKVIIPQTKSSSRKAKLREELQPAGFMPSVHNTASTKPAGQLPV